MLRFVALCCASDDPSGGSTTAYTTPRLASTVSSWGTAADVAALSEQKQPRRSSPIVIAPVDASEFSDSDLEHYVSEPWHRERNTRLAQVAAFDEKIGVVVIFVACC